jgi:hypothetical protein
MDILAHTLWTTAGARKINKLREKKKLEKINVVQTAFWGIFPDLFAFTIPFVLLFWNIIRGKQAFIFFNRNQIPGCFDLAHNLYQYSHSLIIFAAVFLFVWLIKKKPPLPMLGWALHILIDIPSHSVAFFPTPFLFPISTYYFPYGIAWSNMWFMIINYSALLIVWGKILFDFLKLKGQRKA